MKIEEYISKHFTAEPDANFPGMFDVLMDGCFIDVGHTYERMCRMRAPYDAWYEVPGCPQKVYVKYAGDVKFLHLQKVEKVESYRDFDRHCDSRVACIGYSPEQGGWIGWSHRGWNIFKPGYVVGEGDLCATTGYTESYANEHPERCFNLPVGFECKTMEDCRRCAIAYAMAVA